MHGFSGYAVHRRLIWRLRVTGMVTAEIQRVHRNPIAQGFPANLSLSPMKIAFFPYSG
jgi:hypothetical protein